MKANDANETGDQLPSKPSESNVIDESFRRLLEEADAYRELGLYEEAEAGFRAVMVHGGRASDVAQRQLVGLLMRDGRFEEVAKLGQELIARGRYSYQSILDTMLALNFLGRISEARATLMLVEKLGRSLKDDAYQMACFSARLADFEDALDWLLIEFNRSSDYFARSFVDTDLTDFWKWLRTYEPTRQVAHWILQTPFVNVIESGCGAGPTTGFSADDLMHFTEAQRMLFQYDEKAGWYLPYPLAVARAPDVMTGLVAELKAQTVGTVECIHSVHEKAVNLVLDAQPGYAAEHLAWGNHFGARYHILWATSLRPELFQDFVVHPGLGAMQPFLGELMRANESDSGFCKRMEQIRERTGNDRDEAWKLLEASPEAVRDTAVYQLRMAGLYQAEEEYELALPIWAELRKRWPNDASAFSNAIAAHLKLGQRDEAKRLLNNSPACYRRFADYWKRLEEIEGGERKYRSRHFTSFRGQPDLGGLLIPLDAMKPEDGGALMLPSRPISDGSLKAYLRRLPNQKMMLGIVYVEDIYETIFGDGYFTYPNRAFFSFEAARRCAEWISTKPADKEQWWTRAEAKPVEVVLDDKDQLRVPAPQGVEVFNWEQITLIELLNGNGTEWKEIAEARAGAAGKIPVFEDGEGVKTL